MALSPANPVAPVSPRRRALALLAALSPLLASRPAQAQPGNPGVITLYVPWPAGGATDVTLRVLADLAGQQLGQKVIIENRPGAGGSLAMPLLQQAPADGSVLAQMPQPVFRIPFLQKVAWDPIRDTTPILQISGVTFGILVASTSPLRHLGDLLDFARNHPGELSVATNGNGTTPHVVMEELLSEQGLRYIHVPYKGTAEQMLAVAAGQVMVGVNSNGFAPYVDSGRLRLLVTFGRNPHPALAPGAHAQRAGLPDRGQLALRPGGSARPGAQAGAAPARCLQSRAFPPTPPGRTGQVRPGAGLPGAGRLWPLHGPGLCAGAPPG